METRVLVTYASTHGSTQEVAEEVAETLRSHGLAVDLQPARNVQILQGYSGVVLGAPLYMFHLHKDARRFLARQQKALNGGLPVAIFGGGPIEKGDEEEFKEVRKQLDQELAKFPWLKPVCVEVVGGRHDPARLVFPWNLLPALKNKAAIDLRDWTAIRTWASDLVQKFSPA